MGNARWTGVRLEDVLHRAGVKPGAVAVRFQGLDEAVIDGAPRFLKSLDIDHARDGEVMLAYQMNGEQLPLLNGFPLRLIVPGWYSTYWIKMLTDIEVLDAPDDNFWMKTAYRIPDTPYASVKPDEKGYKTVPINRMLPRSFATNLKDGDKVRPRAPIPVRGIAFGGDCGVKKVELSIDGGANWSATELGRTRAPTVSTMADASDGAGFRRSRPDAPLHQCRGRFPTPSAKLESGRVHAEHRRDSPSRRRLIEQTD